MRLFRYRSFKPDFIDAEVDGDVYLWHLDDQNDPFEGQVRYDTAPSVDAIFRMLCGLQDALRGVAPATKDKTWLHGERSPQVPEATRFLLHASDRELRQRAQAAFDSKVYENPALLNEIKLKHQAMAHHAVIGCFSAAVLSPTMLAHYGGGHTGICIEYEVQQGLVRAVRYDDSVPTLGLFDADPDAIMRARVLTKHTDWQYEQEHRLMIYDRAAGPFRHPGIKVTNLYAGFKAAPATLDKLVALHAVRTGAVRLWQVSPQRGAYAFDASRIGS
jgi:hypothetical protein